MRRRTADLPWSVPVSVHEVPEAGRHFNLIADEHVRDAVAGLAGLRDLTRLEAEFHVTRHGREGLRVAGRVSATVGQVCVVTLEPIDNEIEETIDIVFSPGTIPRPDSEQAGIAPSDDPEPLINGRIDLGDIAIEFLLLGIDPYPRKPDAIFTAPATGEPAAHPFAALAALKKKPGTDR